MWAVSLAPGQPDFGPDPFAGQRARPGRRYELQSSRQGAVDVGGEVDGAGRVVPQLLARLPVQLGGDPFQQRDEAGGLARIAPPYRCLPFASIFGSVLPFQNLLLSAFIVMTS